MDSAQNLVSELPSVAETTSMQVKSDEPAAGGGRDKISKSMIMDNRKRELRIVLTVAWAVFTGASSYIIMLFFAMPLSVHMITNVDNGCDPNDPSEACFAPTDESQRTYTLILTLLRICTLLMGSFLGTLSDRVGRRVVILISLFGYILSAICFLIGWNTTTLAMFFVGGILLGAASPTLPHGYAVVSDCSPPKNLAFNMSLLTAIGYFFGLCLGAIVAYVISKWTTGLYDKPSLDVYNNYFNISYGTGLAICATGFLGIFIFLLESLHKDERTRVFNFYKANPFRWIYTISFVKNPYLFFVWIYFFCIAISVGASEAVIAGWFLRRFTLTSINEFMKYLLSLWMISAFGAVIMTKVYMKVGLKFAIHISTWMTVVSAVAFVIAPTVRLSYIGVSLSFFGASTAPVLISLLTGQVPADEKGELTGALRSSEALGKIIGIAVFGNAFASFIAPFTPDGSCVPSDYSPLNKENDCDCGVESCPQFDPSTMSFTKYVPSECTLGQLSPSFYDKPSKTVPYNPAEIMKVLPTALVQDRPDECTGGGGLGDSFIVKTDRVWCASASATSVAYNALVGCVGLDVGKIRSDGEILLNAQVCAANMTSPTCDVTLFQEYVNGTAKVWNSNMTYSLSVLDQLVQGETGPFCTNQAEAELSMCWHGVISNFPGYLPLIILVVVPLCGYVFFVIAEIFFKRHDQEYWKQPAEPIVESVASSEPSHENRNIVKQDSEATTTSVDGNMVTV